MRLYIKILFAVAAVFASSDTASAATTTKVVQTASVESANEAHTDNNGTRFLRKRAVDNSDDLCTEERGPLTDVLKKATARFSPRQKALKLLKEDADDLVAQGVQLDAIKNIVAKAKKGATKEEMARLDAFAKKFEDEWYRNGKW
ncbi:hypothetical protein PHYSODRAFT_288816 [Phytophthora sojae]|uniref:RxLR effector protein n=2 Tax=Phytophthora sojae TaxID=67593 RepID=G5A8F7_PHYSP|nr:hypothetical protein PHYSODRAFT_288816 [Phytophthora sojae]AEK80860.1 Avh184 [Phytophthora sojae]AEK80861.1 Avh184 [Phytophthora sojae]AEK80862.1 Avh184 [Phytophthora sojae]EGZ08183.1 hypothetical protein PHYSODRAFT_288816 [Phytophthora sojae]|eukprot:XP_009536355.1 hypothetical protein PHYSODRAFT_288816 [Phytophthora sojae]